MNTQMESVERNYMTMKQLPTTLLVAMLTVAVFGKSLAENVPTIIVPENSKKQETVRSTRKN